MAPRRLVDFIKSAETYHRDLSAHFQSHIAEAPDEELRMLLEYLSRHEASLQHCLEDYERGASKSVLEAWFKVSPDMIHFPRIDKLEFRPGMSREEVVECEMELDRFLIGMYKELIGRANSIPLRETLMDLLAMEQREEIKMMRSTLAV
jgi:hypothetical protein